MGQKLGSYTADCLEEKLDKWFLEISDKVLGSFNSDNVDSEDDIKQDTIVVTSTSPLVFKKALLVASSPLLIGLNGNSLVNLSSIDFEKQNEKVFDEEVVDFFMDSDEAFVFLKTTSEKVLKVSVDSFKVIDEIDFEGLMMSPSDKAFVRVHTTLKGIKLKKHLEQEETQNDPFLKHAQAGNFAECGTFTNSGELLFLADPVNPSIYVYNYQTKQLTTKLKGHENKVEVLKVSKSDRFVASCSQEAVCVWEVESLKLVKYLKRDCKNLCFSDQEDHLFLVTPDNEILIVGVHDEFLYEIQAEASINTLVSTQNDEKLLVCGEEGIFAIQNVLKNPNLKVLGTEHFKEYLEYLQSVIINPYCEHIPEFDSCVLSPYMVSTLHFYCYYNRIDLLKAALEKQAPFIRGNYSGTVLSPFQIANTKKHFEILECLIENLMSRGEENPCLYYLVEDFIDHFVASTTSNGIALYENLMSPIETEHKQICYDSAKLPIQTASNKPIQEEFQEIMVRSPETYDNDIQNMEKGGRFVNFRSSRIKFDFQVGSRKSLYTLESIVSCKYMYNEKFRTEFLQTLLDEKWPKVKRIILFSVFSMLVQAIMYTVYAVDRSNEFAVYLAIVASVPNIVFEVLRYLTMWRYFSLLYTMFQLPRLFVNYLHFVLFLASSSIEDTVFNINLFVTFILGMAAFLLFKSTNHMSVLIIEIAFDIGKFLIFLFYFILGFSVIFVSIRGTSDKTLGHVLYDTYMVNIGEYDGFDFGNLEGESLLFLFATFVNAIIMLNLLISVVGDTYERIKEERDVIAYNSILYGTYMLESCFFWNRDKSDLRYLYKCDVSAEQTNSDWEGRLKEIKKFISKQLADLKN